MAAWDISSAEWLQLFSVADEDTVPSGIFFKPDGLKMYIVGLQGIDVNEYDLSVAWDVTSAEWLQLFSVATEEINPSGIFFKPDGTKMYIVGFAGDEVNEYDLETPWDITSAEWLQLFSVADEETFPTGIFFKPDGTKMYIVGLQGIDVNEYDLSVAWDVTSAEWLQLFDVSSRETDPQDVFFKPDGTKMYIVGTEVNEVNEYDLETPWDITSAVWLQLFDVSGEETSPSGIFFKPDGTKMYIIGTQVDEVNEYDLPVVAITNMQINISDTFKDADSIQINISDVWKDVVQVLQNIGNVWKNVFG